TAVDAAEGLAATEALRAAVQDLPGVTLTVGKAILEVAVTDMTKGRYLQWYTEATRPDRVVFIGDDLTDETALRVLRPGDVGVKVGDGETAAIRRVAGTAEVADVLRRLTDARSLHNADRDAPAQS
ncbi:trehalose-phosphatase, partial [Corynebacterium provencense]|uniref:trehalose-phosphatase n=1 Tax=Corynebacterium provencense TaxID=1737425 RepID=UPI0028FC7C2A